MRVTAAGAVADPAPRPCTSCAYRRDVPSGVWDASEYDKLLAYDRDTAYQPNSLFLCHQTNADSPAARLCAGWVGCHGQELLALRLGVAMGRVDADVMAYSTDVPLFRSGSAAAEHGKAGIDEPDALAVSAIRKVAARRGLA